MALVPVSGSSSSGQLDALPPQFLDLSEPEQIRVLAKVAICLKNTMEEHKQVHSIHIERFSMATEDLKGQISRHRVDNAKLQTEQTLLKLRATAARASQEINSATISLLQNESDKSVAVKDQFIEKLLADIAALRSNNEETEELRQRFHVTARALEFEKESCLNFNRLVPYVQEFFSFRLSDNQRYTVNRSAYFLAAKFPGLVKMVIEISDIYSNGLRIRI